MQHFGGEGGQIRCIMGDVQVACGINQMNSQANYNTTYKHTTIYSVSLYSSIRYYTYDT